MRRRCSSPGRRWSALPPLAGLERQQLKWFALVGVLTAACLAVAIFFDTLLQVDGTTRSRSGWLTGLALLGIGLPLATGFAIFRHRLYDVDVVIRRTLVYGALTATLGSLYFGLVLLIGLAVGTVEPRDRDLDARGRRAGPPGSRAHPGGRRPALLPPPLRRRADARGVQRALRDELDLETLAADLRGVVRDTVQPAHVSVWLRSPR